MPAARAITAGDLLTFTFGLGMVGEMLASPERRWPETVSPAAGSARPARAFGGPGAAVR